MRDSLAATLGEPLPGISDGLAACSHRGLRPDAGLLGGGGPGIQLAVLAYARLGLLASRGAGCPGGGASSASYAYGAAGRRVRKTVSGTTVYYLYDVAGNQIAEINAGGGVNRQEIYAGGRHLATYANGGLSYHYSDWLGTERATVGPNGTSLCRSLPFGDMLLSTRI